MLNIEGLSKRFPRNNFLFRKTSYVDALNNISFQIKEGDFVGVIGRNGSGKSTLLRTIYGSIQHTEGSILLNGCERDITKSSSYFSNNDRSFFWRLTTKDNLNYFNTLHQEDKNVDDLRYMRKVLKIEELENVVFSNLSAGQKKRVALFRGLCKSPKILFFDEFTESLDLNYQIIFQEIVAEELNKKNDKIIFWASHSLDEISKLCNKVIVLDKGKNVYFNENFTGSYEEREIIKNHLVNDE